jgi:hypothetical protein
MAIISFTVYVEVSALMIGSVYIGFSVDEPLPDRFSNLPGKVIGILDIYGVGVRVPFGPTTRLVEAGAGTHYVILGVQFGDVLPNITWAKLRIEGAGTSAEYNMGALDPVRYVYIAFSVDDKGAVTPLGSGTVDPGVVPIASSGGASGINMPDISKIMNDTTNMMMQVMMPMMMFMMMMNMMMGMMQSMAGAMAGGAAW